MSYLAMNSHRIWAAALLIQLLFFAGCATVNPAATPGGEVPNKVSTPPVIAEDAKANKEDPVAKKAAAEPKIFKGTGALIKPKPEPVLQSVGNNVLLNFEGADVREVAKTILADILGHSYIVDPRVQGSITLRTTKPLPQDSLMSTLESLLKMNGATMILENGVYKIVPGAVTRGSISPRVGGKLSGYSIQIVPLQYIGVREMAKILEPVSPEGAILRIDDVRNLLMIGGLQNEIAHMMDTIETFDVDWISGMSVGLFPMQSADVKTVAADLEKIMGDKTGGPLAGIVRTIPIERLNAILVITPQPKYLDQAKVWIERLDRVGGSTSGQRLFVYNVQNGKAESLANLLSQAYSATPGAGATQQRAASVAPGLASTNIASSGGATTPAASQVAQPATAVTLGGKDSELRNVRIVADKENNALLIVASADEYGIIENALKKLDVAPRQVLIDVTIAEVTLTDDLSFGLEWSFTHGDRRKGLLDSGAAGIAALTPGFSYTLANATGTGIQAALNMLATDKRVNILSSPHIMVADNQQARIQVGDSVPTPGQTIVPSTGSPITSTQYLDTGIILTVTPRISAGGVVNLDVQQEVSNASTAQGATAPTISKRTAKSIVTVQSGETTILGGLIKEEKSFSTAGIPLLSQIPLIGALFGTQGSNKVKTELVILITPRIATNAAQAKTISEEFRKRLSEVGEMFLAREKEQEVLKQLKD
jgi:general secretion pathway protein D